MDEPFLQSALEKIGERNVLSIKVMRNKFSGEPASYGFVNFDNDHQALMAMHKLNGKVIPNTNPVRFTYLPNFHRWICIFSQPVRFKLNHQSTRLTPGEPDLSIWVGDLTPEVDDLELYKFFAARFDTVRTAKGKATPWLARASKKDDAFLLQLSLIIMDTAKATVSFALAVKKNNKQRFAPWWESRGWAKSPSE